MLHDLSPDMGGSALGKWHKYKKITNINSETKIHMWMFGSETGQ